MASSQSERNELQQTCPYLGLAADRASHFSYPEAAHICFASRPVDSITLENQVDYCFSGKYQTCPRFVELPAEGTAVQNVPSFLSEPTPKPGPAPSSLWRIAGWGLGAIVTLLLVIVGILYNGDLKFQQNLVAGPADQTLDTPTATLTTAPMPTETLAGQATPLAVALNSTPTPTPGNQTYTTYTLSPVAADIGWVTSSEERGNHFGDSFLYVGILDGQIYQGAFQFDLSLIPRGAPVYSATIQLTGLRDDRLSVRNDRSDANGTWSMRLLDSEIDQNWRPHSFQEIFNAPVLQTLEPVLSSQDLAVGRSTIFEFSSSQIKILEKRVIEDENPTVSFRIDGPLVGPDNLFAWDTGYGSGSQGNKVTLMLNVGPPPATPPSYDYILVTSTPTAENVMTAAAIALQATADATRIGTATPLPPNAVTATPIPDYLVIVFTPTPANSATAQILADLATAETLSTGTPTPIPTNAVTATPTPTELPPATPTPANYILITATPTPETILKAATLSVAATAQARQIGTSTPLPANWVTPIVVTASPTPVNAATAQVLAQLGTAIALTTGTPSPTPVNVVTATPTPVYEPISMLLEPIPTIIPTPTPVSLPAALLGKILFLSDREYPNTELLEGELPDLPQDLPSGAVVYYRDPQTGELKRVVRDRNIVYVYDPATGELGRLNGIWPYRMARDRDVYSADKRFIVFTKDAIRYKDVTGADQVVSVRNDAPAVYWYDAEYEVEGQLTKFAKGYAYDGAWSPAAEQITFVSNDSGDDEIWVANRDGSNMRQLTSSNVEYNAEHIGKDDFLPEVNRHPSWSPDGKQIVFMSNRTGNQQLWIMNADGSDQRLLMGWDNWTPYNDWAPVWVKYPDTPPP